VEGVVIRTKKRILFAILGLLAIWPLVHVVLVARLELDPWRFCGFAEYATPSEYQQIFMIELRGDMEVHLHHSWFTRDTRDVYRRYRKQRTTFGKLAPPHELAEAILAERPDIEGLKILLARDRISAETSHSVTTPATAFVYRR
jgi:hypothetical protein